MRPSEQSGRLAAGGAFRLGGAAAVPASGRAAVDRDADGDADWDADRAAADRQAGFVTAEAAVVMPALVLVVSLLLWGLMTAAAQIRCVDAARAAARAAARSEPPDAVLAAAHAAAPPGALVDLRRDGDLVRVRVVATALGPGRVARLLSVTVGADAAALAEDTVR